MVSGLANPPMYEACLCAHSSSGDMLHPRGHMQNSDTVLQHAPSIGSLPRLVQDRDLHLGISAGDVPVYKQGPGGLSGAPECKGVALCLTGSMSVQEVLQLGLESRWGLWVQCECISSTYT